MALLKVLDVIEMYDAADVDYQKMVVCVAPEEGYFFRINSKPIHRIPVKLLLADHPFLDYDSYLECSPPLDVLDYTIEQYLDEHGGPLGRVQDKYIAEIWKAVTGNGRIQKAVSDAIGKALGVI